MVFRNQATHGVWCVFLVPVMGLVTLSRSAALSLTDTEKLMVAFTGFTSLGGLLMGWRVVLPAMSKFDGGGLVKHLWHYFLYDLFERRISTVVRLTRRMSMAVPATLQPTTLQEARRMRIYLEHTSASSMIPGEDRRSSLTQTMPGAIGLQAEIIVEDKQRRPSLKKRRVSSDCGGGGGHRSSVCTSPARLLAKPVEEIYLANLEAYWTESHATIGEHGSWIVQG